MCPTQVESRNRDHKKLKAHIDKKHDVYLAWQAIVETMGKQDKLYRALLGVAPRGAAERTVQAILDQ